MRQKESCYLISFARDIHFWFCLFVSIIQYCTLRKKKMSNWNSLLLLLVCAFIPNTVQFQRTPNREKKRTPFRMLQNRILISFAIFGLLKHSRKCVFAEKVLKGNWINYYVQIKWEWNCSSLWNVIRWISTAKWL